MCTCQIIDCLKAKKGRKNEYSPFQSWWGSVLISCLFRMACPGDECRETEAERLSSGALGGRRLSCIGPVTSLFLKYLFFPSVFLLCGLFIAELQVQGCTGWLLPRLLQGACVCVCVPAECRAGIQFPACGESLGKIHMPFKKNKKWGKGTWKKCRSLFFFFSNTTQMRFVCVQNICSYFSPLNSLHCDKWVIGEQVADASTHQVPCKGSLNSLSAIAAFTVWERSGRAASVDGEAAR